MLCRDLEDDLEKAVLASISDDDFYRGVQVDIIDRIRKGQDPEVERWEVDGDGRDVLIEGTRRYIERLTELAAEED